MDGATLIETALVVGAAGGATDVAKAAVTDSYKGLKELITSLFRGKPADELVLAEHDSDPDTWKAPLIRKIQQSGADENQEILEAARRLLELGDPVGSKAGKYIIDARKSVGMIIGDNAHVTQNYGSGPAGAP